MPWRFFLVAGGTKICSFDLRIPSLASGSGGGPNDELSAAVCVSLMLFGRDKVLATDQTGRASIYDAGLHALRPRRAPSANRSTSLSGTDSTSSTRPKNKMMLFSVRASPPLRLSPTRASAVQMVSGTMTGVATLSQCRGWQLGHLGVHGGRGRQFV